MNGKLVIVGVPIGNVEDCSFRVVDFLKNVHLILCEDTRESKLFMMNFTIKAELISYIGSREFALKKALIQLQQGNDVALVCDRGMPCISDPGAFIVSYFRSIGFGITCLPGASSVTTAFALTGYSGGFIFHGFLPRKKGNIVQIANDLVNLDYNIIFFESPIRLNNTLQILAPVFANRDITIARELTKTYEEIIQGKIEDFVQRDFKGECVIVIKKS